MIQPTVGRVVWYWPNAARSQPQPFSASIAYVHSDRCINIGYIDHNGLHAAVTSVALLQDGDEPIGPHCQWMPYQVGQAAKHATEK